MIYVFTSLSYMNYILDICIVYDGTLKQKKIRKLSLNKTIE